MGSPVSPIRHHERIIVCLGPGGVGKTTTSAALALKAAQQGKRVLCLTIDPARRLAESLGLPELIEARRIDGCAGQAPIRIDDARFRAQGLTCAGELHLALLDAKQTFDALVRQHAQTEAGAEQLLDNRLYGYVSEHLAGTQEYMAMEALYAVADDKTWDLIVLDTPPTSHALDFLDAPQRLSGAIDSPAGRWIRTAARGSAAGLGPQLITRGLARITGSAFFDEVAAFLGAIDELFGGFRERARRVDALFRDETSMGFLIVTVPESRPLEEALFVHTQLCKRAVRTRGVILNRVMSDAPDDATAAPSDALSAACAMAVRDHRRRVMLQRRALSTAQIERLGCPVIEVPALASEAVELRALAELGPYLPDVNRYTSTALSNAVDGRSPSE